MIYLQLFLSFLQIGALSFGGGYAALALIQEQVVTAHGWLSVGEFADLLTLSQMTPGPIAINAATFVGTKVAGAFGAVVATFGCVLPSCIFVAILAKLYLKYREQKALSGVLNALHPAVVALIASAGLDILLPTIWSAGALLWQPLALFAVCMLLLNRKGRKMRPVAVMLLSGVLGLAIDFIRGAL